MWTNRWMDRQTDEKRTNEHTEFHQFRKEPSLMVIYLPDKFEFDWSNRFKVRVRKRKCGQTDGWTDKRTNEHTEFHQFRKEPSYDGDLSPCEV